MARGKKKETLTPEERLQAALVPENEQPYKVPRNWCWTRLGFLLQSSKEKTDEFSDAGELVLDSIKTYFISYF